MLQYVFITFVSDADHTHYSITKETVRISLTHDILPVSTELFPVLSSYPEVNISFSDKVLKFCISCRQQSLIPLILGERNYFRDILLYISDRVMLHNLCGHFFSHSKIKK